MRPGSRFYDFTGAETINKETNITSSIAGTRRTRSKSVRANTSKENFYTARWFLMKASQDSPWLLLGAGSMITRPTRERSEKALAKGRPPANRRGARSVERFERVARDGASSE